MSSTCSSAAASTPAKAAARARSGPSHKGIGSPGAKHPVIGYSRHKPFEHIYRHHRRYRITEGAEEIQMRKVGAYLFGYLGPRREKIGMH